MTDQSYLRLALSQARLAQAAGEVPVGALVVRDGRILASGENRVIRESDPTAHAEVVAMRLAGHALGNYRLTGCTVYATLEPCAMCAGALMHARIERLVYAARDAKAGADGSVLQVINFAGSNHRMQVEHGTLAEECSALLRSFFAERRRSAAGGIVE